MKFKKFQNRHAASITRLSRNDLTILSSVLYLPLQASSLEEARLYISLMSATLPRYLWRSKFCSFLCKPLRLLPTPGKSCRLHRRLNHHLIGSILHLVQVEVGPRLDRLSMHRAHLTVKQRVMLDSLREINGMWMRPAQFEKSFGLPRSTAWSFQGDGCEACMLARILQNATSIMNLRTVLLSRTRTRGRPGTPPQLIQWVDVGMDCHPEKRLDIFVESADSAAKLKEVRKEINKGRRSRPRFIVDIGPKTQIPTEHRVRVETETKAKQDGSPKLLPPRPPSSVYSDPPLAETDSTGLGIEIIRLYRSDSQIDNMLSRGEREPLQPVCRLETERLEQEGSPSAIESGTSGEAGPNDPYLNRTLPIDVFASSSNNMTRSDTPKTSTDWADEYQLILNSDPRVDIASQGSWEDVPVGEREQGVEKMEYGAPNFL
ncbi:predicted protein [Uncinocarpus reesii 1704]|uniref:Uncharacterized protein n=1 Tax=Uncinocarpus reesii (strain UAMH 1704) TaxID=336963 RepID=C4JIT4_UNCRE|nr:uncharacterized protein UREG_02945 [Uncinocarpus reesii 1704]EEP78096.1 predicted protein [Uncinocarpus reesii 1704]